MLNNKMTLKMWFYIRYCLLDTDSEYKYERNELINHTHIWNDNHKVTFESEEISPIIKHLPFIQTFTNIIAVAIENKNLAKEAIRQERIKKELELASEMQTMLLPTALPKDNKLDIAAFYKSHQQVGGDYYDVIWVNKTEIAMCIADVSGKGVSAAILMNCSKEA